MTHYKFLSESFLSKYRDLPDPFPSALSAFTYARTYSRFLPELHRRERWFETVARAVDFNLSLAPHDKFEAEQLFDNVFNLRQNLSGRMTWLGGTDTANSNGCGLFNCAFDVVDSFDVFVEAFTLLMLGAGVGLRITKDDVSKLPIVRTGVDLVSKRYVPIYAPNRNEYTTLREHSINNVEIIVGDSRGAWTDALNIYFNLLWNVKFKKVTHITMNYDNIRGKGEPIKGFGGKSSGYQSMMDMFEAIHKVLQKGNTGVYKLKTIDALDIAGLIALNVVSGNVRRSSLMVLCNPDDSDVINAKENLYTQVNGKWVIDSSLLHRQMSNNTVMYHQKPSREQWKAHFEKLRFTGEPAFANMEQVVKRNPKALGLNP